MNEDDLIRELNIYKQGDWTIKKYTEGKTNQVYLAVNDNVKHVLRVFGSRGIIDRTKEHQSLLILGIMGFAPKILHQFTFGLLLEYISGTVLDECKMYDYNQEIAKMMSKWHKIRSNNVQSRIRKKFQKEFICFSAEYDINDDILRKYFTEQPILEKYLEYWCKLAEKEHKEYLQKMNIEHYIDKVLKSAKNLPLGLCHNDLLASNIIKKTNSVYFIDYEYTGMNYVDFDIGNHLAEYAGYDVDLTRIPNSEYIKEFLIEYGIDKDELNVRCENVKFFINVSHLFWGLWALLRTGEFDYHAYAKKKIEIFVSDFDESFAKRFGIN